MRQGAPTAAQRCCAARRFGKKVPAQLVELVQECWAPAIDDRPDFSVIAMRFEHIWATLTKNDDEENDLVSGLAHVSGCCTQ